MKMTVAPLVLAALLAPRGAGAADPAPPKPTCTVTVGGAVTAKLDCTVKVTGRGDGSVRLTFSPQKLPKSLKAFIVGEFDVPAPARPGAYAPDQLTSAQVLLTDAKHATYAAEKTKAKAGSSQVQRGDVKLTLSDVRRGNPGETSPHRPATAVSGSYEARLVPASGKGEDVVVKVAF